ncbi:MAG: PEP-CTERM sorting domain-containing protein [Pseudomonadota bacterium]
MKRAFKTIASTILFAALSTAAQAVTFDFAALGGPDVSSFSQTSDGITVTVTAGTFGNINTAPSVIDFDTRMIDPLGQGLGVDGSNDNSPQLDGRGANDVLVFTFSQAVRIDQILFGNVNDNGNDNFTFGVVNGTAFDRLVPALGQREGPAVEPIVTLSSVLAGNASPVSLAFGIGAIQNNDNFSIAGLEVTAVPVPASLPLLAGALGFAAFASRRRKSKAAA